MEKATPGTMTGRVQGFGFTVKTGDGHLLITRIQPQNKAAMDAPAFLNGYRLEVGDRLGVDGGQKSD
jgi:methionyl-tRNA formyltransferase